MTALKDFIINKQKNKTKKIIKLNIAKTIRKLSLKRRKKKLRFKVYTNIIAI